MNCRVITYRDTGYTYRSILKCQKFQTIQYQELSARPPVR
jgi:hypothetical protein